MVLLCPGLAVLINLVAANRQCQFSCWHVLLVGASHIPVLCNLFPASELVPTILNGSRQPVNPAICVALPPLECINFCHLCFVGGRLYCLNWWCLMMENENKSDVSLFCIILYLAYLDGRVLNLERSFSFQRLSKVTFLFQASLTSWTSTPRSPNGRPRPSRLNEGPVEIRSERLKLPIKVSSWVVLTINLCTVWIRFE